MGTETSWTTDSTSWKLSTWIGDPIPYDTTIPYPSTGIDTGCNKIYPYYPYQPIKEDETDKSKEFIKDALSKRNEQKIEEENLMKVFEVTVIDRRECEILHEQKVIAKDKETAMLELNLTPEIKKKVKKDLIEFIFNEIGSFTKAERKIKVKDLVEEE